MATLGELTLVSSQKCFGGFQKIFSHKSSVLNCAMRFAIYLPKEAEQKKVPVLYYLSGLTCTEKNFIEKAGSQQHASNHGVAVVAPDTSPRGCNIPGEEDSYDFGSGAGFYVDSTQEPWKNHYKMHSYVTKELPSLVLQHFPLDKERQGIFGHSMGGHGALICVLKNPGLYKSVSAFAPICNPMEAPWGSKALSGYLGEDKSAWNAWDASELSKSYNGPRLSMLITTGDDDEFLKAGQLKPEVLVKKVANNPNLELIHKLEQGYDHSYYFVATFMKEHFEHHMNFLKK